MTKILIIEDNSTDQLKLKRHISKSNIEAIFEFTDNIVDGSKLTTSGEFDYVFCDYHLPDGSAIDYLRSISGIVDTPVVVLSSLTDLEKAVEALKIGAFDYIEKQNFSAEIFERIHLSIERSQKEIKLREDLQRRLDENYANTKAILENTQDGIWSLDENGKLVTINNFAKKNINQLNENKLVIGDDFFRKIHPKLKNKWFPLFKNALTGKSKTEVHEFNFNNQDSFFIEATASPIKDDSIRGVTFFAREVTERVIGEQRIKESEQNFRSIFEESDIPIIVESKSTSTILDANQAFSDLLGHKISTIINSTFSEYIPSNQLEELKVILKLYQDEKIDVVDTTIINSLNKGIPVQLSIADIDYNSEPANLIFVQDISKRKETEKQLQKAKELAEKSAKFKSQFLANMSHEIRTPLNAMMGFTDLLADTKLSSQQNEYIEIIQNSSQNLLVIINDILDLTKIEAGEMKITSEPFSIRNVIQKTIQLHKHNATSNQLAINHSIDESIPDQLIGSEARITQIINNLISNAIKFTEEGEIKVEAKKLSQDEHTCPCEFNVRDTGIGMTKEELKVVFDNFIQLNKAGKSQHKGTGLGLSIVKQLTHLMGGTIDVKSTKGVGTEFTLQFKFKTDITQEQELIKKNIHLKDIKQHHLLICEDNLVNQKLISKVLQKLGVSYEIAENGQEGIEKMEQQEFTAILMDLQMPILDGYDTTKKIRETSNIPIIAMSAHVLEDERKRCYDLGMNGFVSKPFKVEDLKEALSDTISTDSNQSNPIKLITDLNMPVLEELSEGDVSFIIELFDIYVENTRTDLDSILNSSEANKTAETKRIAHKLKPSLSTFNLNELHQFAEKIEEAEHLSPNEIDTFINEISKSLEFISAAKNSLI